MHSSALQSIAGYTSELAIKMYFLVKSNLLTATRAAGVIAKQSLTTTTCELSFRQL